MSTTLRKSNKPTKSKFSKKKTVLTVMRIINAKGRHERTTVEIKSQHLFELLLDINSNMDELVEGRSPPTVRPPPNNKTKFANSNTGRPETFLLLTHSSD